MTEEQKRYKWKSKRLLLTLAAVAMLCVGCDKTDDQSTDETFGSHPTWTEDDPDSFWEKQPNGGFQIDTAWDGDTIFVEF